MKYFVPVITTGMVEIEASCEEEAFAKVYKNPDEFVDFKMTNINVTPKIKNVSEFVVKNTKEFNKVLLNKLISTTPSNILENKEMTLYSCCFNCEIVIGKHCYPNIKFEDLKTANISFNDICLIFEDCIIPVFFNQQNNIIESVDSYDNAFVLNVNVSLSDGLISNNSQLFNEQNIVLEKAQNIIETSELMEIDNSPMVIVEDSEKTITLITNTLLNGISNIQMTKRSENLKGY